MSRETVTSHDVAKLAGVSQSAVSRTFRPGASVSAETVEKVKRAAETLGYRPNVLARSLVTGRSRIIGLVVGYFDNCFYPEAVEKFSRQLQAHGYHVLVFMASQRDGTLDRVLGELLDYQVDGIVLASVAMSSDIARRCTTARIPVVLFNRSQDDMRLSAVTSDNRAGGWKLARFLIAAKHRRIAHIAGWSGASTQRDREAGFVEGLAASGLELHSREVGNFDYEQAREATHRMFARRDPPDAIFVANDHMAFSVLDTLRGELGMRVPEDVSVVGYDDVSMAGWRCFDLTTVRQRSTAMVDEAIRMLFARIEERHSPPERIVIDGPLVIRGSARKPPAVASA